MGSLARGRPMPRFGGQVHETPARRVLGQPLETRVRVCGDGSAVVGEVDRQALFMFGLARPGRWRVTRRGAPFPDVEVARSTILLA